MYVYIYIYIYIHIEGINKHTRIRIGLEEKGIYSGLVGICIENERKKTETYILLARVSFKALPSCFSLVLVDLPCLVPLP